MQRSDSLLATARGARSILAICALLSLFVMWSVPAAAQTTNLGTYSIGQVEIPLFGGGTWTFSSGALPPGISLRPDAPPWAPTATATLSGVATTPNASPYSFTLLQNATPRAYTLKISALDAKEWNVPDAFVGASYSYQLAALNNAGVVVWTPTGTSAPNLPPPGMTLSPSGLLSGTPTTPGFYNIQFKINDGVDTVFRSVSISVYAVRIVTDGTLPNTTVNVFYDETITASGGTGPYKFTSNNLPTELALSEDGRLSGTITTTSGKWSFDVSVVDALGVSYSKRMALSIINSPPNLLAVNPYGSFLDDCSFGTPCNRGISVGSGRAPYTWSVTGLPSGMSFRSGSGTTMWWIAPGDVELWGTPTQMGTFPVTATVTDADGQVASNTFDLNVSPMWLWNGIGSGNIGVPFLSTFRVLGGHLPYSLAIVSGKLPLGLTFDPATLTISGTPLENGSFSIVVEFADADGKTLSLNQYPFIGSLTSTVNLNSFYDLGTITEGFSYSNQLQACCLPSYNWILGSGSLPSGITLSSVGMLNGTPASGTAGTYTFVVRVEDATNSANYAVREFTLVVTPLSLSSQNLPIGNVGTPYNGSVTATGGSGIVWTLQPFQSLPPGLTLHPTGVIDGTPTARGFRFFQLKATDSAGHILLRFFSISIYADGEVPPLNLPFGTNLTVAVGTLNFQLNATGGVPPYHYSQGAAPIPGMRVQDGQPLPISFPSSVTGGFIGVLTTPGTFNTSLHVDDAADHGFDRAASITVSPLQVVSVGNLPRPTVGVPYSFTLTPYGGTVYSWSATNLPPGLSVDASGQIFGTPTASGSFSPRVTLTDLPTSNTITRSLTLNVDPYAVTTGGVLPQAIVNSPYTQTLNAPGCGAPCVWPSVGTLFGGLTLSPAGVLSGTPTFSGTTSFAAQVSGSSGTVQKTFFLAAVSATPQPLTPNSLLFNDTTVGSIVTVALIAQGGVPPYVWSKTAGLLPPGTSLQGPGETLGSFLTPGAAYVAGGAMQLGVYNFTLTVTDSVGTAVTLPPSTWKISPLGFQYVSLPVSGKQPLVYNTPYTQPLLVIGGTNSYTFSGVMPPGLSLDPLTGVVSGTPTNTGFFSVPIQATDGASNTFTANVSVNVAGSGPTTLNFPTSANLGTIASGSVPSYAMTPTNGTAPYTITALTSLPPGFDLVPTSGAAGAKVVTGIAIAPGSYTFTIQALDSLGNIGVRTFALKVSPFAVLGSSQTLPDASISAAYSHTVTVLNGAGVSWSPLSSLPAGLTLSTAGVISGTPSAAGTFTFSAMATDSASATSVTFSFTLRVSSIALTDPTILPTAVFGTPYSYTFTATGGGPTKVWSANGLPQGVTMSAGTISGTPIFTGQTSFAVQVTVTDGVVPVTHLFTLPAVSPNPLVLDIGLAGTALVDAQVGRQSTYTLTATGGRPPYTWAPAPASPLPPGLSLLTGTALSAAAFAPGTTVLAGIPTAAGAYSFDLIATDTAGSAVRRTFTLNISTIGIVNPGVPTLSTTGSVSMQFVAVGGTPPYSFDKAPASATQDMLPPGVTLSTGGLLSGMPTTSGFYRFVLKTTDATGATFGRIINLTVASASGLIVGNNNLADGSLGRGLSQSLNAISITGTPATYTWSSVGALPAGLRLVTDPSITGSSTTTLLAGQPTAAGTFTYTLRATNTSNFADVADHVFTLRVSPMQVAFPALGLTSYLYIPSGHVGEFYSTTIKMAGGTPPYTFASSGPSANFNVGPGGVISGTPLSIGRYVIPFTVTDSASSTFATSVTVVVTESAAVPPPLLSTTSARANDATLGLPYLFIPDFFLRGGVAPYNWVLDSGTMPPGLTLFPGANGVPTSLAGLPTAAGSYAFALAVTDGAGQHLTIPVTMNVAALGFSLVSLPSGIVGQPYSALLGPVGGTPPYVIDAVPTVDLPAGLLLSNAGVLSGAPQSAGIFLIFARVTDALGNSLSKAFFITVDNAAGEAPAVRLAPNPIQIRYELGAAAPGPTQVAVNTTSGAQAFTLSLSGAPWANLSSNSGTASSTVNLNLDVSSLVAGTYFGVVGVSSPNSISKIDMAPIILTVAVPPPCTYSVGPTAGSVAAGGGGGGFSVSTGSRCLWNPVASDPWIIVSGGAGGPGNRGNGTVTYSASPNPSTSQRTGTITVSGAVFTITQFGSDCAFTINPSSLNVTAAGGTATIAVTASASSCVWPPSDPGVTPGASQGSGTAQVTIPVNPGVASRTLTVSVAGQMLTINQQGAACTTALDSATASFSPASGTGSIVVTTAAGCGYSTVTGPSWIHITSGGSGSASGTLGYSVDANSETLPRTGALVIGGQPFQITQEPLACSATIDTTLLGSPFGSSGGTGSVGITVNGSNCSWTASSDTSGVSISPSSGTGNGTLFVAVGSNAASTTERFAHLTIAGQTIDISQGGTICSYALQSATGTVPASGGSGSVGVIAPAACTWGSSSNAPTWLTISSSGSGGSGDVNFIAQPNPAPAERTGSLTIAGLTYTVTQAAASCAYTLSGSGVTVSSGGGSDSFTFSTTTSGCSPNVQSYASWLHVTSSLVGTSGSVSWTADLNPSGLTRSGTIQVGTQTFVVTQLGSACAFSLNNYGKWFTYLGGTNNEILGSPSGLGCTPVVGVDLPSIVTLGLLSGPVSNIFTQQYDVLQFTGMLTPVVRRARITFGGQIFIVKQSSW